MIGALPRVARVGTSISLNLILRRQMELVAEAGYDLVCVCDDDDWAQELRRGGFEVWPIGMGRRPGLIAAAAWSLAFYRLLRRHRVQVVHTHNAFHGIAGRIAARAARTPVVVQTVHNWWYLEPQGSSVRDRLRARLYRLLERLAAAASDAVMFINHDDFREAVERRIVAPDKRVFIGNGIDTARFTSEFDVADRDAVRKELGLEPGDFAIAMIARLEPPKDHATFLRAFADLSTDYPNARVVLIGYGLLQPVIEQMVVDLGLSTRVTILGYRSDVAALLAGMDCVALSTTQEGFGRALVEGMVAGLPVIASDVVGTRDVVRDGETGLLVPPGDPEAFRDRLARVLSDVSLRERLGSNGRRYALEHFDESLPAARVADTYARLLS